MTVSLPYDDTLPIHTLAACFNDTSTTYKYYWFLSLLQAVEKGETNISKQSLFAGMVANAWYTVNYFNVSFGKQDLIQQAVKELMLLEHLGIDENKDILLQQLTHSTQKETGKKLHHFDKTVPHWFLRPWFIRKKDEKDHLLVKRIYEESQKADYLCLYALHQDTIVVNAVWQPYLYANSKVLKDFVFWNLCLYLQARNPNVPDIPNKLFKQPLRNALTKQRKEFWDVVLRRTGTLRCIYTGRELQIGDYAVEHFIPYSFVSHDLIWNLIPADPSFNSAKSNKLPPFEIYFDAFFQLQKEAIEIVSEEKPNSRYLEDYLTILPDLRYAGFEEETVKEKFRQTIQPLLTIAANNGFQYLR